MPDNPKPKYPGWDVDLGWQGGHFYDYPAAIYPASFGSHSDLICVREVAMMLAMDRLTDKPDWHIKVFDDDIVAKWRAEIMAWPDDDLWNRIAHFDPRWLNSLQVQDDDEDGSPSPPDRPVPCPKDILNYEAADYASPLFSDTVHLLTLVASVVHSRNAGEGRILYPDGHCANLGRHLHCGQVGRARPRRPARGPSRGLCEAQNGPGRLSRLASQNQ